MNAVTEVTSDRAVRACSAIAAAEWAREREPARELAVLDWSRSRPRARALARRCC